MSLRCLLPGPEATDELGRQLSRRLPESGVVVHLHGDLGAGKSSLARAMLRALGVKGAIKSPTYTLVERYETASGLALHLDLYRIAAAAELEFLGVADMAAEARLWLVEWPQRGGPFLPAPDLGITLSLLESGREAWLEAGSPAGAAWLADLAQERDLDGIV